MAAKSDRGKSSRDGEQKAILEMRARAVAVWGEERAAAIEQVLERTARAVWKMSRIDFAPEEGPAFFLGEFVSDGADREPEGETFNPDRVGTPRGGGAETQDRRRDG